MNRTEYDREYQYRLQERLGMICEDSSQPGGQRPVTSGDERQARIEVAEDMDRLEVEND